MIDRSFFNYVAILSFIGGVCAFVVGALYLTIALSILTVIAALGYAVASIKVKSIFGEDEK